MTGEDKAALVATVTEELNDSAYGLEADVDLVARLIVDRIEPALHQQCWMPPATSGKIHDWGERLGKLPEHHINRDVLNSHLAELWAIL